MWVVLKLDRLELKFPHNTNFSSRTKSINSSSTIESITNEKYISKEVSRVHLVISGNGRQYIFGNRIYIEDIVSLYKLNGNNEKEC